MWNGGRNDNWGLAMGLALGARDQREAYEREIRDLHALRELDRLEARAQRAFDRIVAADREDESRAAADDDAFAMAIASAKRRRDGRKSA